MGRSAVVTALLLLPSFVAGYSVVTHQSPHRGSANPLRSRGIDAASRSARRVVLRSDVTEEDDALTEEQGELIAEAQEIAKRKRQNMFNEDGVAYAPWLVDQVDDDAMQAAKALRQMRKKKERDMEEESKGYVSITEATTSELSGLGLKVRCCRSVRRPARVVISGISPFPPPLAIAHHTCAGQVPGRWRVGASVGY
jgi:hypothetical protein